MGSACRLRSRGSAARSSTTARVARRSCIPATRGRCGRSCCGRLGAISSAITSRGSARLAREKSLNARFRTAIVRPNGCRDSCMIASFGGGFPCWLPPHRWHPLSVAGTRYRFRHIVVLRLSYVRETQDASDPQHPAQAAPSAGREVAGVALLSDRDPRLNDLEHLQRAGQPDTRRASADCSRALHLSGGTTMNKLCSRPAPLLANVRPPSTGSAA